MRGSFNYLEGNASFSALIYLFLHFMRYEIFLMGGFLHYLFEAITRGGRAGVVFSFTHYFSVGRFSLPPALYCFFIEIVMKYFLKLLLR